MIWSACFFPCFQIQIPVSENWWLIASFFRRKASIWPKHCPLIKLFVYSWPNLPGRRVQELQKPATGPVPVCKVGTTANWLVLGLISNGRERGGRGDSAPKQPPPFWCERPWPAWSGWSRCFKEMRYWRSASRFLDSESFAQIVMGSPSCLKQLI